ncbi:hypothetical protein DSL72_008319 [Monilinia vaccinii-corymbosi]|uniref:DUF8035 domain-containing protein n=1 Tax=Monilinia vaccinii-corymbosi TaxID=61207 RepID=A0A8A3PKD5_9HELO|nr:hypothetical protein DSL72_008319 [Monilinia vaccinii-corymbosi]
MSFGASPSDLIIAVTFCRELYRKCRSAGGEYDEISREVRGLHTVLKDLKSEVEDEDSPVNRDQSIWERQLAPIIGGCDFTLRQLDGLLLKTRFGSGGMDQLGGIRVKLISHKTTLSLFLDSIQMHENSKMAESLHLQGEQLDIILDKVDHIAAKMSLRSGTSMTSYEDDDTEVWKQFRRELISEGFSSDVLQQHKDVLRAYIRQTELDGLLVEETPTPPIPSSVNPHTERWCGQPSFFDVINTNSDANEAKEMRMREDNMKFTTSMKLERPQPESCFDPDSGRKPIPIRRQLSPPLTPKISNSDFTGPKRKKDTSGSESASNTSSIHRRRSPSKGSVIQTSDLPCTATPQPLPSPSPSSYHSHPDEGVQSIASQPKKKSGQGSSPRTSGVRFDLPDRQPSPTISTPLTGNSPRPDPAMPSTRLAPDSHGNEISPDAKWTKVKRSLISPEVLNQDGRRYEARPEFVAILGILTKEEIQDYASRSHILREQRWFRHHRASVGPEQRRRMGRASRTRRRRSSSASESSSCSSDSASDSDSLSNDDRRWGKRRDPDETDRRRDDREYRRRDQGERGDREERSERRERVERRERDREPSYTPSPTSAPHPSPQPPLFSSSPQLGSDASSRPWNIPGSNQLPQGYPPSPFPPQQGYPQKYPYQSQQYPQGPPYPSTQQYLSPQASSPTYSPSSFSPSSKSHNPDHHSHRRRHHHSHHSHHSRDRDRDLAYSDSHKSRDGGGGGGVFGKAPTTGSRWRDHLAAAGLGGAAVGLLSALSEAADGY